MGLDIRKIVALLLALLCAGCANYQANVNCRIQAGDEPYFFASALGPVGEIAANQTDSRADWNKKVDDCFAKYKKDNP